MSCSTAFASPLTVITTGVLLLVTSSITSAACALSLLIGFTRFVSFIRGPLYRTEYSPNLVSTEVHNWPHCTTSGNVDKRSEHAVRIAAIKTLPQNRPIGERRYCWNGCGTQQGPCTDASSVSVC